MAPAALNMGSLIECCSYQTESLIRFYCADIVEDKSFRNRIRVSSKFPPLNEDP